MEVMKKPHLLGKVKGGYILPNDDTISQTHGLQLHEEIEILFKSKKKHSISGNISRGNEPSLRDWFSFLWKPPNKKSLWGIGSQPAREPGGHSV